MSRAWVLFAGLVVVAGVLYAISNPRTAEEGGGRCALIGFVLLSIPVLASVLETLAGRRRQRQHRRRGFEVVLAERPRDQASLAWPSPTPRGRSDPTGGGH